MKQHVFVQGRETKPVPVAKEYRAVRERNTFSEVGRERQKPGGMHVRRMRT